MLIDTKYVNFEGMEPPQPIYIPTPGELETFLDDIGHDYHPDNWTSPFAVRLSFQAKGSIGEHAYRLNLDGASKAIHDFVAVVRTKIGEIAPAACTHFSFLPLINFDELRSVDFSFGDAGSIPDSFEYCCFIESPDLSLRDQMPTVICEAWSATQFSGKVEHLAECGPNWFTELLLQEQKQHEDWQIDYAALTVRGIVFVTD